MKGFFINESVEVIYYLTQLDGKARADKLGIQMKHYASKKQANIWHDKLLNKIKNSEHELKDEAIEKLEHLYKEMIG